MNTKEDMFDFVESENQFIEDYKIFSSGWNTVFALYTTDCIVLEYLNNNNFPIVYSDTDGFILVKF